VRISPPTTHCRRTARCSWALRDAQLITECNLLRKETRELRVLLDKAQNELQNGGPAKTSLASRRAPSASQGLLRPSTAGSDVPKPLGASLSSKGSKGTLLTGSAGAMGRERARTAEVLITLEANQREMAMQRAEILRLREQVQVLTGDAGAGGAAPSSAATDARPNSSIERPIKHSPMPRPPRAASALD